MNALGLPLLGDPVYPVVAAAADPADYRRPLQLLARTLSFTDPVTGREHRLETGLALRAWEDPEGWERDPGPTAG